jgi:chemosensory pili system protein ChpA (sensor histidine kinase/response regulator)
VASDPELIELFFAETATNTAVAQQALAPGRSAPPSPGEIATVARAFHTLAGTAGLLGHSEWGRLAAAAEPLARRWMETGRVPSDVAALLQKSLEAIAGFAKRRSGLPPPALKESLGKAP